MSLTNKIDFAVVLTVNKANPNGDPLNGNRPRQNYEGYGEISDVAIKRKIRNRLLDMKEPIFVQSDDRNEDGFSSLKERTESHKELKKLLNKKEKSDQFEKIACAEWIDVRAFGQVFAFKGTNVSIGIRGPVSIHPAISVSPITITDTQITKSVNSVDSKEQGKRSSDTMGMKHRVDFGVYVFYGSINTQLAQKTGFSDDDAEKIKEALTTLFMNDASSARPEGSMEVHKVYWWQHHSKLGQLSAAKVHRSLSIEAKLENPRSIDDYEIEVKELPGLPVEVIDGT